MQGRRIRKDGDKEIWVKQLKDGSRAVILFNRGKDETEISVNWTELGYPDHVAASVRDLWAAKDLGKTTGKFSAKVASHETLVLKVTP